MEEQCKQGDDERPVPLEHQKPADDWVANAVEKKRKTAGVLLATAAVLGLVFFWIITTLIPLVMARTHGQPVPPTPWVALVSVAAVVCGPLIGRAIYLWHWKQSRGFAIGLLIGVGVGMLIEGLCFMVLKGK